MLISIPLYKANFAFSVYIKYKGVTSVYYCTYFSEVKCFFFSRNPSLLCPRLCLVIPCSIPFQCHVAVLNCFLLLYLLLPSSFVRSKLQQPTRPGARPTIEQRSGKGKMWPFSVPFGIATLHLLLWTKISTSLFFLLHLDRARRVWTTAFPSSSAWLKRFFLAFGRHCLTSRAWKRPFCNFLTLSQSWNTILPGRLSNRGNVKV